MRWFNFTTGCMNGINKSNDIPFTTDSIGNAVLNTDIKDVRLFAVQQNIVVSTFFWECDTITNGVESVHLF